MAPSMAASSRAPPSNSFFLCLILLFLHFFASSTCLLVYDRQTLLDIKDGLSYNFPEFKFCNTDAPFADPPFISPETPLFSGPGGRKRRRRGRRSGVLVRLRRRTNRPPLPSLLLANVQSLENKLCELRARISFQREMRDCCVICLTETWLSDKVPDSAIQLPGFSVHRADRSQDLTGKSRGGGVCFMINNSWCDYANVHPVKSFCSPDLEYLMIKCRPFWLPREFTAVIITAVYIPPQADTDRALRELYSAISSEETAHPEAAFITAGDFNKGNLKKVSPKLHQHIHFNTRGDRLLDHCYTSFRDAYKALPRAPFGQSDHRSILLLPAYRQKLKQEAPTRRAVHCWTDQSESALRDCFDHADWEMFHVAARDIDEYTDSVCGFIRKCVEDVVPSRTVKSFPNQKPWINGDVRAALAARSTAFASANTSDYKHAHYQLRKTIKAAKREYRDRVEQQFDNPRSMWQGLNTITDFRGKTSTPQTTASLCEDLNVFYARFDTANTMRPDSVRTADDVSAHTVSEEDVRRCFRKVNARKATGPDGIPGRVLKSCAAQLAGVFTHIFNLSLSLSVVPACFKMATIVPVPKSSTISSLNDWRPVALTPIVSKCFEKLVRDFICSALPDSLDPLQFAYRHNRSTDDAIALTLHTALSHLEKRDTYVRMLFVDYSSAFNTIVPSKLDRKLQDLGLSSSLCSWILSFLSDRRQVVRLGSITSSPITLNTGAPQGCVLSPLLYSLYTYDCTATNNSNIIVKFADDTTVVGLITNGDETAYREEVSALTHWCQDNHLTLNVAKTKELIVDFRRCREVHTPITINGAAVERVSSFRFLGVHLAEDLTWSVHTNKTVKKAQQRLFFLRRLKRFGMSPRILRTFYHCAIESILTGCITTWYGNSTAYNCKALQRVVRCSERIIGGELPSLQDIYRKRCLRKAGRIIKDSSHPSHKLFRLLPSGRRFCSIRSRTSRLRDSFFHQAIRLLNTS